MYLKLTNGQPEKYSLGQLRRDNPNVSFPETPTDALLAEWNVYPYTRPTPPDFEKFAHRLTDGSFVEVNGAWLLTWAVAQLPQDQAEANVRLERDRLLQETDWIVIKAYERNDNIPAEWEMYRQALRDLTAQEGFPYSVDWPIKPE